MNRILAFAVLILVFAFYSTLLAGDNPLVSKEPDKKVVKSIRYPAPVQKILNKIVPLQRKLNRQMVRLTREIKDTHSKRALFIIVIISFIYGIIHALGPGHGKTITFSYFLLKRANIRKGIIIGNLIAFLHVGSALIIVLILYLIVKRAYLTSFEDLSRIIKLISYALITLIGLFLLIKTFVDLRKKNSSQEDGIFYNQMDTRSMILPIIAVGMIPCPGAVIILLFSISMDVLKIGIILALIMALGMAVTISSVGVLTIIVKQGVLKFVSGRNRVGDIFQAATGIIGSLLILLLGAFLFIGSI